MKGAMDWVALGALLAAVLGVVVAVWSHRKATYAQIVVHYSERFERLLDELLHAMHVAREEPYEDPSKVPLPFVKYFNLTYEEWYMARKRYFPRGLWKLWIEDITVLVQEPVVRRAWEALRPTFERQPRFQAFLDALSD